MSPHGNLISRAVALNTVNSPTMTTRSQPPHLALVQPHSPPTAHLLHLLLNNSTDQPPNPNSNSTDLHLSLNSNNTDLPRSHNSSNTGQLLNNRLLLLSPHSSREQHQRHLKTISSTLSQLNPDSSNTGRSRTSDQPHSPNTSPLNRPRLTSTRITMPQPLNDSLQRIKEVSHSPCSISSSRSILCLKEDPRLFMISHSDPSRSNIRYIL